MLTKEERDELTQYGAELGATVTWDAGDYMTVSAGKLDVGAKQVSASVPNLYQGKQAIKRYVEQVRNAGGAH